MTSRSLIFLFLLCYTCVLAAAKTVKVEGKEYTVSPYPEDCTKYLLCRKGNCNLVSCQYTYVFDPATSTCTHRTRGNNICGRRFPRKPSPIF